MIETESVTTSVSLCASTIALIEVPHLRSGGDTPGGLNPEWSGNVVVTASAYLV